MVLFENKKDCCGCSACKNICPNNAINMISDNEGFWYPDISNNCVNCGLCVKVCPVRCSQLEEDKEKNKKHIGIINLQYTANYGAVIAAAVLEDVVGSIAGEEYTVKSINYIPEGNYKNKLSEIRDKAKQWGGWKLYLKSFFPKTINSQYKFLRNSRFLSFKKAFLNLTPTYSDAQSINNDLNYSAFITGSDIVWAPKKADNFRADGYFLKFANNNQLRIAFAPSLDNKVDKKLLKLSDVYKENLKSLDFISVREKSNIDFIQSLTDKKVYHCCDPAFLVSEDYYDKMISTAKINNRDEKYIYVYILEINQDIVDYANKLALEKNLKICYYSANHNDYNSPSEDCTPDGPAEFLYRLKNAEYVLTNSFHCVVFSLLFKRKFLSFIRSDVSVKATDLLDDFDLSNRIAANNSNIDDEIDFNKVDQKLNEIRNNSTQYLKDALRNLK